MGSDLDEIMTRSGIFMLDHKNNKDNQLDTTSCTQKETKKKEVVFFIFKDDSI